MPLSKFQEIFKGTILNPELLDSEGGAFRENFRQDHGICLENRMKVYRNNVIRSLIDAGLAAYKMSQKLVGYEFLEAAMNQYVVDNLPSKGNLNLYAMEFPEFLKTYAPARNVPYLPDFAQLEAYWESAYYAADEYPLDLEKLGEVDPELFPELKFTFRKSFALLESDFPLDEIVDYCRAADNDSDDQEIKSLGARGCKLMILRPEYQVEIRKLSDDEYHFLQALSSGKTIDQSAEGVESTDITAFLQKHFELGTFTGFNPSGY